MFSDEKNPKQTENSTQNLKYTLEKTHGFLENLNEDSLFMEFFTLSISWVQSLHINSRKLVAFVV